MKRLFAAVLLAFSCHSFAETPLCDESYSVIPCHYSEDGAKSSLLDMMLDNKDGMALIHRSGESGLMIDFLSEEESVVKVTLKSMKEEEESEYTTLYTVVTEYEVYLLDCRGTDVCTGHYLWKVTETSVGDGYLTKTTYQNQLSKL